MHKLFKIAIFLSLSCSFLAIFSTPSIADKKDLLKERELKLYKVKLTGGNYKIGLWSDNMGDPNLYILDPKVSDEDPIHSSEEAGDEEFNITLEEGVYNFILSMESCSNFLNDFRCPTLLQFLHEGKFVRPEIESVRSMVLEDSNPTEEDMRKHPRNGCLYDEELRNGICHKDYDW